MKGLNNMSKKITPFVTPDSLRKTLNTIKSFNDLHTSKNNGREDIMGSQYASVVDNFGSELLIETRKLLMDQPSINHVFNNNTFDFYFDIQYSDFINTYSQQNMLVALLKKDVLLDNKEYRIRFDDCVDEFVVRAESWSDPTVYREKFIRTKTPPTLVIRDKLNTSIDDIQISLYLTDDVSSDVDYYFPIMKATQDFIDTYIDGIMTTVPINNAMSELPFVWICIKSFQLLPEINFVNNIDYYNRPLLTIGTDGHNVSKIYPMIYGESNIPSINPPPTNKWYLKANASETNVFINSINQSNNYAVGIDKISFINTQSIGALPHRQTTITFDTDYLEITLSKDVQWSFKAPVPSDHDYDGTTYINPVYAYIELDEFPQSSFDDETDKSELLSAFIIKFKDNYLDAYEGINGNAVTGIHIDASSDYSDNSILKKNGIIHDLGDFDGLPSYFKYMFPRTIHHAHTELYSIRDDLNNRNQKITDKQVSALILDTAIPQDEADTVTDNLNIVIKYDINRRYISDGRSVSPSNILSEITFVSRKNFSNYRLPDQEENSKFVYHGKRLFSLAVVGLDAELEYARVYYINNDKPVYNNNNMESDYVKPQRTLARICDIPTTFSQLMNVTGVAPTLIVDEKYIRSETNYSVADKDLIYNTLQSKHVKYLNNDINNGFLPVYEFTFDINNTFTKSYLIENGYARTINLNSSFRVGDVISEVNPKGVFTVNDPGTGYVVDDKFSFIIGGLSFRGTVTDVDVDGIVSGIDIDMSYSNISDDRINVGNLDGNITVFKTVSTVGDGTGLSIKLTIDENYWNSLKLTTLNPFDDLYTMKLDEFGYVWIWRYNNDNETWYEYYQLTGLPIVKNYYDDAQTRRSRNTNAVLMNNWLMNDNHIDEYYLMNNNESVDVISHVTDIHKSDIDITSTQDHSAMLSEYNEQDTYYVLSDNDDISLENYSITKYHKYMIHNNAHKHLLPRHHQLNLNKYTNKSCALFYSDDTIRQPSVYIYDPSKNVVDEYEEICNDVSLLKNRHDMTFADIFKGNNVIDKSTGRLKTNVYEYNEYRDTDYIIDFKNTLLTLSRESLVELILEDTDNAYPLQLENTQYQYTKDMLIDYIIANKYNSPVYKKNDIKLLRQKNDPVVEYVNGEYVGIGEQPTGGFNKVSSELFVPKMKVNNEPITSSILFVFKIPDGQTISDLNIYRMKNDNGDDISKYSLLIYQNDFYVFNNNTWVKTSSN